MNGSTLRRALIPSVDIASQLAHHRHTLRDLATPDDKLVALVERELSRDASADARISVTENAIPCA